MEVACCSYTFGGAEAVSMSMCAVCWLLRVLGLLHLLKGATETECSSCFTHCMMAARLVGVESTEYYASVGLHKFALVLFLQCGELGFK